MKLAEIEKRRASTYHAFTAAELEVPGRFAQQSRAEIVGGQPTSAPWPKLPDSSPWSGTPPDEPWRDDPPRDARDPLNMGDFKTVARDRFGLRSGGSAGRFQVDEPYIVGSTPIPQYPAAYGQRDPSPVEPPLSPNDNPALEPPSLSAQADDPVSTPPRGYETTPVDSEASNERAGSSPFKRRR